VRAKKGNRILNSELVAIFDKTKTSDRNVMRILTATVKALGLNPDDYALNYTSLYERRRNLREEKCSELRKHFRFPDESFLVLHWDGKLLPSLTGREKADRLAIVVTYDGEEQLLGVPETGGTGQEMSEALYDAVMDWEISEKIIATGFDTTSSNTGSINGACQIFEFFLGRNLLRLACRHHIYETKFFMQ
jgi:hypothetical protein